MLWLNPDDPRVRSAVVSGGWGRAPHSDHAWPPPIPDAIDTITEALQVASDILQRYTGFAIHPAGTAVETFIATPQVTRLSPTFIPLRQVLTVAGLVDGGGGIFSGGGGWLTPSVGHPGLYDLPAHGATPGGDPGGWLVLGDSIVFSSQPRYTAIPLGWWWKGNCNGPVPTRLLLTLEYQFGSTINAAARRAVIALAHQFYLESSGCEGCQLPDRATSVTREGVMLDLDTSSLRGRLGVAEVDSWLDAVNPYKATMRSGVWTPDAPPPATSSVRSARPDWMGTARSGGANLSVGAVTTS